MWSAPSCGPPAEVELLAARCAAGDAFHHLAPAVDIDDLIEAAALLFALGVEVGGWRDGEVTAAFLVVPGHRLAARRLVDRPGELPAIGVVHVLADHAADHGAEQGADRGPAGAV